MKVAIFSSDIVETDGYGNITNEYCKKLLEMGIEFELFVPWTKKSDCIGKNFKIHPILPPYIFRMRTPKVLGYFFERISLKGFDLVHSLFDFPYCFLAARVAKRHHLPFMMGAQGTYGVLPLTYWPEAYFLKWAYRRAQRIVVPSQFTKEKIIEYAKVRKDAYPISVIHNGVNFDRFDSSPDISDLRMKYKEKKVLLTVGGLKPRKGQDLVLKALPEVLKKHPNAIYVIAGSGHWRGYLEQLANELHVQDHVEFTGVLKHHDLVKYFHVCDVYVHTPRVVHLNFEGFGIVYLEASACGKPIVATDAGGIRDAVIDGRTGLIAPDGDVAGIAERISYLLDHEDVAQDFGRNGKEYAQQNDWQAIAEQFIQMYQSCIRDYGRK